MSDLKLFGVVGNPVKHSISPRIHAFWYEQLGISARYVPLELSGSQPVEDLKALARAGFSGLNITLPYKTQALEAAAINDDAAVKIGAANTLTRFADLSEERLWKSYNTDCTGFMWSLTNWMGDLPKRALLIGAGGAAAGVAYALDQAGVGIDLINRTEANAVKLAKDLDLTNCEIFSVETLSDCASGADLVINTASLGHSGQSLILPGSTSGHFMDISYGKAAEQTLKAAKKAGWKTLDGLPMLVGQAADAFRIWFDVDPDREACLNACREWTGT